MGIFGVGRGEEKEGDYRGSYITKLHHKYIENSLRAEFFRFSVVHPTG